MYLYCISDAHGLCKFGYSKDPLVRLRVLQTGSSSDLRLLKCVSVCETQVRYLEAELHREIGLHRRVRGEWFDCDPQLAESLMSWFEIKYCG